MIIKAKKGGNYFWTEKDSIKYYNAEDKVLSEHAWTEVKSIDIKGGGLFGGKKVAILYFTGEEYEIPIPSSDVENHLITMVPLEIKTKLKKEEKTK